MYATPRSQFFFGIIDAMLLFFEFLNIIDAEL